MVVKDIQSLLENFFADGFTMDSLCKATEVTADLINKACAKEKLDNKMPMNAVSNYLGLDEEQYKEFLCDPERYSNGCNLTVKLLHLFTSLVRQKE